jgi:phosphoserine phosphatase RsbU/P
MADGGSTTIIREQLLERRVRLESAIESTNDGRFSQLLQDIDSALEQVGTAAYGMCRACHEPIEAERLISDPLTRYCLDHLTPDQRCDLERDLSLAADIQSALLPNRHLRFAGWEVYYHYQPAGVVSGDYCDLLPDPDSQELSFLLGDVSGKGIAASMLMTHMHAMFRTLSAESCVPSTSLAGANRIFCESTIPSSFATLVAGRTLSSGRLRMSNAGHCPPFLVAGSRVSKLEFAGLPLGLFCSSEYPSTEIELSPGDTLFLYSDGLYEAQNGDGEDYGLERISEFLAGHGTLSPELLIKSSLAEVKSFCGGVPLADDLTLMAIQRIE